MKASTILLRAKQILSNPDRWCQGSIALDVDGDPVGSLSTCATRWCSLGAIRKSEDWSNNGPAVNCFLQAIGLPSLTSTGIGSWNDAPERTHAEVMEAFDKAIKIAEEQENESQRPVEESIGTA